MHECSEDVTKGLKASRWLLFIMFILKQNRKSSSFEGGLEV